jgi:signal transduction histidine kinase
MGAMATSASTARAPDGIAPAQRWPVVVAAALGLFATVEAVLRVDAGRTGSEVALLLLLAWAATAPLALIDRHPVAVIGVIASATAVTLAGGQVPLAGMAAVAVSVSAVGLGAARRARRTSADRAATRRTIAETMLEHAARGERARIARELHDVVAHHISMIVVQAETARLTTPGMPPDGAARLLAIGDTARSALTEMRRLLGVLREDSADTDQEPTRAPQPGLRQLNELVDSVRESTMTSTRLIVRGQVAVLDPGVELTAYRLIQEALTNACRYAPGAAVDVELDYTDTALRVRVRDNGPGGVPTAGHGLLGMRERAAMVGGTVSAGPAPGTGFLVQADLPRRAS